MICNTYCFCTVRMVGRMCLNVMLTRTYIDGLVCNTDEVLLELNFCSLFMGAPGFIGLVSVKQI